MADFEDAVEQAEALRFRKPDGSFGGTATHLWTGTQWKPIRGYSFYQYHYQPHHVDPDGSIGYSNRWVRYGGAQEGPRPYSSEPPPSAAGASCLATLHPDLFGRVVTVAGWYGRDDFKLYLNVEVTNDLGGNNGYEMIMAARAAGQASYAGLESQYRTLRFRFWWQNELNQGGAASNWSDPVTFI